MMTSVDLCAMYKEWDIQKIIVNKIMEEFWQQVCLCKRERERFRF
jgi:hypothetical protein